MTVNEAQEVTSRLQLAAFVEKLYRDVVAHPERAENLSLEAYLEAMSGYLRDLPGFVRNSQWPGSAEDASWSLFAAVLAGAVVYE